MKTASIKQQEIDLINQLFQLDGYFADSFKGSQDVINSNINNDFPFMFGTGYVDEETHNSIVTECDSKITSLQEQIKERDQDHNGLINLLVRLREQDVTDLLINIYGAKHILKVKRAGKIPFTESEIELMTNMLLG